MKKIFAAALLIFASCSTYSVDREINGSGVEKSKKIASITRVSARGRLPYQEVKSNMFKWLAGYKQNKEIVALSSAGVALTEYNEDESRFYQVDPSGDFLKYKSVGTIKGYLRANSEELKNMMEAEGCDYLMIYEPYAVISSEIQYMSFESLLVIVDKKWNIVYLDHQKNNFNASNYDFEVAKSEMLDKISERFIETLKGMDVIEKL